MKKSKIMQAGKYCTYATNRYDEMVVYNARKRLLPNEQKAIYEFVDQPGERTEFKRLMGFMKRGDHLVISSVVALEDKGNEETIIRKLRQLDRKGVNVWVALESEFHFGQYDTMFRKQLDLQEQRKVFYIACVPPEEKEKISKKGGDSI